MLLTDDQIAVVERQAEISPIPADHAFAASLMERFGHHTFYLGSGGLYIAEPMTQHVSDAKLVQFIQVAAWVDDSREHLAPIDPEPVEHAVDLQAG